MQQIVGCEEDAVELESLRERRETETESSAHLLRDDLVLLEVVLEDNQLRTELLGLGHEHACAHQVRKSVGQLRVETDRSEHLCVSLRSYKKRHHSNQLP
jgi:hypothetical protein